MHSVFRRLPGAAQRTRKACRDLEISIMRVGKLDARCRVCPERRNCNILGGSLEVLQREAKTQC
jgi:hypothetical protein